jgi:predicted ATP-grasp superfamily ATP-dependent carboligase
MGEAPSGESPKLTDLDPFPKAWFVDPGGRYGCSVATQWVLVTDGGDTQSRSSLAAVRALGVAGYRCAVTVSGRPSLAAISRYCARRVPVPGVTESGFAEAIRGELSRRPYLTVISATDATLLALDAPVRHLVDKIELAKAATNAGLSVPPTRVFNSITPLLAADDLDLPAVLKPPISNPFKPARLIKTREDLASIDPEDGPFLVQPFLDGGLRACAGVMWEGQLVAAVHQRYVRTWPPDCGTASSAVSVAPDEDLEGRLIRLLDGYQGIFQAQLAGEHLLDLNPRVYGSLPLAVAAGANLPAIYCDLLSGKEMRKVRARPAVFYRWLEGDLRHLAWAVRHGEMPLGSALLNLRPHRGTAHSTESVRDPMPMGARLRHAVAKYRR